MRLKFIGFILIFSIPRLSAQLLDDSTKLVYGPNTLHYFYEKDWRDNSNTKRKIDSSLVKFQRFGVAQYYDNFSQDLGNFGTANLGLIQRIPTDISQVSGFGVFDLFEQTHAGIRYFNTKSPYTEMNYEQSSNGFTHLYFLHSQNVQKNWNAGFYINKYNSSKQYSFTTNLEQLVNHWDYGLNTNYVSTNGKYGMLASFIHNNHRQNEQGGVKEVAGLYLTADSLQSNYASNYEAQFSTGAYNRFLNNSVHFYQQYELFGELKAYNVVNYDSRKNITYDPLFYTNKSENAYNLDAALVANDSTINQLSRFRSLDFMGGLTGRTKGADYNVYFRGQHFKADSVAIFQPFLGGNLGYFLRDSLYFLTGQAEISLGQARAFTSLSANISSPYFEVQIFNTVSPIPYFFKNFDNGIKSWNESTLENQKINSTGIFIKGKLNLKKINFNAFVNFKNITNQVYIDSLQNRQQYTGSLNIVQIGGNLKYQYKHIILDYRLINSSGGQEIMPMPTWMQTFNLDYSFKYSKGFYVHIGLDGHKKSAYSALAYSPLLQQFYIENANNQTFAYNKNIQQGGFWVFDPYLAFNIKRVKVAIKYAYANKLISKTKGFYASPDYLMLGSFLGLKLNWPLFD